MSETKTHLLDSWKENNNKRKKIIQNAREGEEKNIDRHKRKRPTIQWK